jgi:hypothetical protein
MSIIDIAGKIIYSQKNISSVINIEKLEQGIYIIKLTSITGTSTIKFVKE